mgnify:CR=1 FL=1
MDRRDFLKAGIAALAAPALAPAAEEAVAPDVVVMSSSYNPENWHLNIHQPMTPLGERQALEQMALGYRKRTELPGFPNPPSVFEMRPLAAKPNGGWWEFVPDQKADPRYYLVGPARFTVEHKGVLVADSGPGKHWEGQIPFDALFEWSKLGTGRHGLKAGVRFDESKVVPLAAEIAKHLTNEGYWRMFEILKEDKLAGLVLQQLAIAHRKGLHATSGDLSRRV